MADNDAASSNIAADGDDVAGVGKIDVTRDGTPSSMESTPEQDTVIEETQEPAAQPQKRKGGRKPVSQKVNYRYLSDVPLILARSTPRQRSASNAIDKLKPRSESVALSTSSNSRQRSSRMKIRWELSSRVIVLLPMNV